MLGLVYLQYALSPASETDRKVLQLYLTALLTDLRRNPTRLPQLRERCLAVTDYLVLTESKLLRVPVAHRGGFARKLLVDLHESTRDMINC
jgi:hypothetical protein